MFSKIILPNITWISNATSLQAQLFPFLKICEALQYTWLIGSRQIFHLFLNFQGTKDISENALTINRKSHSSQN